MFSKILICGAGAMGSQIGFQCAVHGLDVVMYDIVAEALDGARNRHAQFADLFVQTGRVAEADRERILGRISYNPDLAEASSDVDIVSESVLESIDAKKALYSELSRVCPERTVFTTNTSTMKVSDLAPFVDRPSRFLALHFAIPVWETRLGEVMAHPGTDPTLVDELLAFASQIGLIPIRIEKEQPGYVLNTILVPFIASGLSLVVNGVASPEDVDRTWMTTTKAPMGPIGWIDLVGVSTTYHVLHGLAENGTSPELAPLAAYLKENLLDKGRLGAAQGQGFYTHPNPPYERPDFLA